VRPVHLKNTMWVHHWSNNLKEVKSSNMRELEQIRTWLTLAQETKTAEFCIYKNKAKDYYFS